MQLRAVTLPLALLMVVTAYHKHTPTATGGRPRAGICAGPRRYLNHDAIIAGRRYRIRDVCPTHLDIWLPTRKQCRLWGRRRLRVRIIRKEGRR